jgi:hypothetical protein
MSIERCRWYVFQQWGFSKAQQTTPFNIAYSRSTFMVNATQADSRGAYGRVGVAQNDYTLTGFYATSLNTSGGTFYAPDAIFWFSTGA